MISCFVFLCFISTFYILVGCWTSTVGRRSTTADPTGILCGGGKLFVFWFHDFMFRIFVFHNFYFLHSGGMKTFVFWFTWFHVSNIVWGGELFVFKFHVSYFCVSFLLSTFFHTVSHSFTQFHGGVVSSTPAGFSFAQLHTVSRWSGVLHSGGAQLHTVSRWSGGTTTPVGLRFTLVEWCFPWSSLRKHRD